MSVVVSTLGAEAEIVMGQSPPGESYNRDGNGVPLLNGPSEFGSTHPAEVQWTTSPTKFCEPGDVLFCVRGATAGRLNTADKRYCIGRGLAAIRGKPGKFDNRYLLYVLANGYARFQSRGVGSTFINISADELAQFPVPSIPLSEQRRIAEMLDKADALRAKRRAVLAYLDTLTQSIFLAMFGDPATNPKGWPVKRIADIAECLDRLRRPVTESDRKRGQVPYYGANGQQGWIDTALFDEPLVLVAEDGGHFDTPERGVAYRIDGPAWVNNHAHILRARPADVQTEFLHRALRHFNFLPYISGTTRAKLTQGQLNSVKLFVPPLQLQHDFTERVTGVQRIAQTTARSGEQLEALFASLQCRAFRGDVLGSGGGAHGLATACP